MASELLTVPEVGRELRISRQTAYRLIKRGAIPAIRLGRRSTRVRREALDAFVAASEQTAAGPQ